MTQWTCQHECCIGGKGLSFIPAPWPQWTAHLHSSMENNWSSSRVDPAICSLDVPADVSRADWGQQPIEVSTWHLRAWWAGISSVSRTMWPNVAVHCWAVWSANGKRSVRDKMYVSVLVGRLTSLSTPRLLQKKQFWSLKLLENCWAARILSWAQPGLCPGLQLGEFTGLPRSPNRWERG